MITVDFTPYSTERLIDAMLSLTHRLRSLRDSDRQATADARRSLREQRDAIRREIIRRAGDAR